MAKQRYVNTKFWDDNYIVTLNRSEKLLFLYLLTNPLTNIAGAYEINLRRISFDTDINQDEIVSIFNKFSKDSKITYRCGWVVVHNFIKNQSTNPKVETGIDEAIKHCPDWIKQAYREGFDSLSYLNLNSDSNSDPDLSVGADSPNGEIAQLPRKKRAVAIIDKRKDHPAVKIVHGILARWPHKDIWDRIIRELGDTPDAEFFRKSFELWRSVNGNPMNLEKWLFEPAKSGNLPEIYGANKQLNGNGNKPTPAQIIANRSYRRDPA